MTELSRTLLDVGSRADGTLAGAVRPGRNGRIFGGQLSAQSLSAAGTLAGDGMDPHSLHLAFVASGDAGRDVEYVPSVLRAGRSFTVVRVDAVQDDRTLATSTASFHLPEESQEYGVRLLDCPDADECPPVVAADIGGASPTWAVVEARLVDAEPSPGTPGLRLWMRWRESLGSGPLVHACAMAWVTDLLMVRTAGLTLAAALQTRPGPSLDHALWIHRPLAADGWFLVDVVSLVRSRGRAFNEVRVFDRERHLVATSVQECLLR